MTEEANTPVETTVTHGRFMVDGGGRYLGAFYDLEILHDGERHAYHVAAVPAGAAEVPKAPENPAATWDGAGWQEPPKPAPVLNPARFEWMLAYTGLGDVWDALEAALRDTDRATFAVLRAQRVKTQFHLETTLGFVAQHRTTAKAAFPDVDLSETAIRDAWALAAGAQV